MYNVLLRIGYGDNASHPLNREAFEMVCMHLWSAPGDFRRNYFVLLYSMLALHLVCRGDSVSHVSIPVISRVDDHLCIKLHGHKGIIKHVKRITV